MFGNIRWRIWTRRRIRSRVEGFLADATSWADTTCNFGDHVRLHGSARVLNSNIGRFTYIVDARISNSEVGNFCSIGPGAMVGGLGRHPTDRISTHPLFYSTFRQVDLTLVPSSSFEELPRTYVGHDVWIGAKAIILDGVSIGNGAIIGAGAVVNRDVPPYGIVGGIPAKLIKYRHEPEMVDLLLSSEWWEMSVEELQLHLSAFGASITPQNISRLIEARKAK